MKLFWKEVNNVKGRKVASFSIIMDRNRRSAQGEDGVQRIWKEYFEQLYNIDTQVQVAVQMCGFDGIRRDNYFGGEPIGRVGKLKTAKTAGGDEITEEIIKGGGWGESRKRKCFFQGYLFYFIF